MSITPGAADRVRRICQDHVDARARYRELVDTSGQIRALRDATDQVAEAAARHAALGAYARCEYTERAVRELAADEILAALEEALAAQPPTDRMATAEVRRAVALRDAGRGLRAIAEELGRSCSTVSEAIDGWRDGTSYIAREAKRKGRWR